MFRRVELFADEDAAALGDLDGGSGWDADRWEDVLDDYFDVRQIFDDPARNHDWGISAEVDLAASDETGTAVVRVTDVNRL